MAWPEGLTSAQQAQIEFWLDQIFRAGFLQFAKALGEFSANVMPGYLASPSGAASTFASPASDSVAGLLATLPTTDQVPVSTTGLAGAGPVEVEAILTYMGIVNSPLLATYWSASAQAVYAEIIGAPNV
jgi:hypothetical protein